MMGASRRGGTPATVLAVWSSVSSLALFVLAADFPSGAQLVSNGATIRTKTKSTQARRVNELARTGRRARPVADPILNPSSIHPLPRHSDQWPREQGPCLQ